MAFDKLEVVVRSGRGGMPVSVTLSTINGGLPRCLIGMSAVFTAKAEIKANDKFDVLLGAGDQKGLLRLKRSKQGLVTPKFLKAGSVAFSLGYIERFGSEKEPKAYCNAEVIDSDTIEIVLPPWSEEID